MTRTSAADESIRLYCLLQCMHCLLEIAASSSSSDATAAASLTSPLSSSTSFSCTDRWLSSSVSESINMICLLGTERPFLLRFFAISFRTGVLLRFMDVAIVSCQSKRDGVIFRKSCTV
ncbi:hypothetical protein MRB53_037433 [Persea americana]|nr:hypothetical protein MRB53_037433 [Persea americana]